MQDVCGPLNKVASHRNHTQGASFKCHAHLTTSLQHRNLSLFAVDVDAVIGCVQAVLELSSMAAPKAKVELRLKNLALQVCAE